MTEPVDRTTAAREFRVLQAALHTSTAYRDSVGGAGSHVLSSWGSVHTGLSEHSLLEDRSIVAGSYWSKNDCFHKIPLRMTNIKIILSVLQVFKMLNNKESLDQIIVATPGLINDPIALGT